MVVEDDPLSLKLTADLLEFSGFNVMQCACGDAALAALKTSVPDLILLDIGMPGIDGFEVHKRIRQDPRLAGVKVVALSASVMKEDMERINAAGFDAFIPKPIDVKDLAKKVKGFLL